MKKELKLSDLSMFELKRKELIKFHGGNLFLVCSASCSGIGQNDHQKAPWTSASAK